MNLPTLKELPSRRDLVEVFGGYNHNLRVPDGEFYDMKNMSSAHYPVLATRGRRGVYALTAKDDETGETTVTVPNAQAIIAKDSLCYLNGTDFYVNGYHADLSNYINTTDDGAYPKRLVSMGAYVIILPDKVYFNTADFTDFGFIEESFETVSDVTFELCMLDGVTYGAITSDTAPEEPDNMQYWIDTSSVPHSLKCWSKSSGMWVSVGSTYIKITSEGIGKQFEEYDGVTISGLNNGDLTDGSVDADGKPIIIEDKDIAEIDGSFVIWAKADNYIVVIGMLDRTRTLKNKVKISRTMPNMDFVIESENRLWGCRYGTAENGDVVNEIYASKLGDFKNWNCFMGVSTDSYVASVGSDGKFTGAITHMGYPIFFKENCMHKVYGNFPSNYQVQTTACRGVQLGCDRSLAIVNEVLYYKSRNGVCAYDGSLPAEISARLGDVPYEDAVAGSHGNKYYISMKDATGSYHLFVYDAQKGLWHKEDEVQVDAFCSCRNELYYIDHKDGEIKTVFGSGLVSDLPVEWMVETGEIGVAMPDQKYISRVTVRMSLEVGGRAKVLVKYDSDDSEWEELYNIVGRSLRSFAVPIRPRRCDHFRLRVEGDGEARIYSIAKTIEQGSDYTDEHRHSTS